MQLNVTTDYAIRIVLYLAIKKEITTSKEIGAANNRTCIRKLQTSNRCIRNSDQTLYSSAA